MTLMADERFALGKDETTNFVDLEGHVTLETTTWSEIPHVVAHDPPFLIACLNNSIEIRTEKMAIQSVDLPKPLLINTIHKKAGVIYVASASHIWCLKMVPISVQIPRILKEKQFELALTLTSHALNFEDKVERLQKIQTLYAFDLFCNMKFKEAMDVFYKLDVDASHVIGLYHDLFPSEFRNKLSYPDKLPMLKGQDLDQGYSALVEYLTNVRHKLQGSSLKNINPLALNEGCMTVKSKRQLMQIIDTTLLKCYLKVNDSLVASLLRLKNNYCHLEETERALKKAGKFAELIIFYNTKELHEKALGLLKEQSDIQDSTLYGTAKTVAYLQNLNTDHIDLVCKFAEPVLEKNAEDGLAIFTEDLLEVENWPRAKV